MWALNYWFEYCCRNPASDCLCYWLFGKSCNAYCDGNDVLSNSILNLFVREVWTQSYSRWVCVFAKVCESSSQEHLVLSTKWIYFSSHKLYSPRKRVGIENSVRMFWKSWVAKWSNYQLKYKSCNKGSLCTSNAVWSCIMTCSRECWCFQTFKSLSEVR